MNSGTEAILMAIRLGRLATKKLTIVTFTNSYHGWADAVMVRQAGDHKTVPLAPGILNTRAMGRPQNQGHQGSVIIFVTWLVSPGGPCRPPATTPCS